MGFVAISSAKDNPSKKDKKVKVGLNIGDKAPDIVEKGVDGKYLRLSSLKGKIVLIDFWASWCLACRHENPHIVNAYNTYKDKEFKYGNGFAVFSVSLDRSKMAWKRAISTDHLSWPYHVSDLGYWYSKYAGIYQIRTIPSNFLIDGDGIIITRNLSSSALESVLKQLVK